MPPKKKGLPAPIDRPLSRAYLREFSGWSTAYPPGKSDPTSLRVMENMMVNRDGSMRIRPGLKYLSYLSGALPIDQDVVGTHEVFFLNDGSKAYLFAVREDDLTVGFRVLTFSGATAVVNELTAVGIDFDLPTVPADLRFTSATTYVKYLQIDNKIFALSNAGETMRLFYVGADKLAKVIASIDVPNWTAGDKLTVVHPDAAWINSSTPVTRTNFASNPSFETSVVGWTPNVRCTVAHNNLEGLFGSDALELECTVAGLIELRSPPVAINPLLVQDYTASVYVKADSIVRDCRIWVYFYNNLGSVTGAVSPSAYSATVVGSYVRYSVTVPRTDYDHTKVGLAIDLPSCTVGDKFFVDGALIEQSSTVGDYFDGSSTDTATEIHSWDGADHLTISYQDTTPAPSERPTQETPTGDTLVSSNAMENQYNYGFFYTFSNEVGESMPSQITVIKAQKGWTAWAWETPNAAGEPSGTETTNPALAADQLVAYMPQGVFDDAVAAGATQWQVYVLSWSNQDAVPVEGVMAEPRDLTSSPDYDTHGWIQITPQTAVSATESMALPALDNRINSSDPSRGAQGLVASDRMVLVNDPSDAGVIRWTSSRAGQYLNFSAAKGGGYKTLSSGNLYVPACVKLWQNPQSVDTLTILCLGIDGYSTSYYMAPGQVTSQSDAVSFMGFEETTATPGTVSPFGCEVLNNALYHPLETELMKSTASNYNISHKTMTELIANMWGPLADKDKIVSSQLDNRLYYIVHNPGGEALEAGCWGNEIWVCDTGVEGGSWSRWLIQAQTLRKVEYNGRVVMSVVRPDGIYCLDELESTDEYVSGGAVLSRAIPWRIETNTQGANRAHDAWAHLQQVSLTLGNFLGQVRWGVKGWDLHGKPINASKVTKDSGAAPVDGLPFDIEDHLLVRRDMKEWHFYAESVDGQPSAGQLSLVQYRYTPVSVNVGYEYGSVETFEYGNAGAAGSVTFNGVPIPAIDTRRP